MSASVGSASRYRAASRSRSAGIGVLERVQHRQRLLVAGDVGRHLARLLLEAPDAQQVVVELEREAQRPAEPAVARDDLVVVRGEDRAGLDRARDQRRGLAADHVEVELDGHRVVRRRRRDVDVLALAQRDARLVVQAHQAQDRPVREAEVGQPVEGDPRQAEDEVAGVDRLGDAVDRPQGRPVAALDVAILDVVVDEAEVVAQLDGRRARAAPGCARPRSRHRRGGPAGAASACRAGRRRRPAPGGSGSSRTRRSWTGRGPRPRAGSPPRCRRGGR